MIEIAFNNTVAERRYRKAFFERVAKTALTVLGWPEVRLELSISLVGEQSMRSLNQKYRGENRVTDVLSFPLLKKKDLIRRWRARRSAKKTGDDIIGLGDIFICPAAIRRQARQKKKDGEALFSFLTAHSILHLLGFDHERAKDRKEMEKKEDRILSQLE